MDDTNLVRFMQDLVNNPEELRRYKQDPSAYLAQAPLSQAAKDMLIQFSTPPIANERAGFVFVSEEASGSPAAEKAGFVFVSEEASGSPVAEKAAFMFVSEEASGGPVAEKLGTIREVSTVFTLKISPLQQASSGGGDRSMMPISLENQTVELLAPNAPVIIEATGPIAADQCSLFPHSYIHVDKDGIVLFNLHVAYINPEDRTDYTYVFDLVMGPVQEQVPQPAGEIPVSLSVQSPLVLTYNKPILRKLGAGSSYDPSSGTLTLNFD